MIFFFDRNISYNLVKGLGKLGRKDVEFRSHHSVPGFKANTPDDEWMAVVGAEGWIVVTQDYKFHKRPSEHLALWQYNLGCFYLWGAQAPLWDIAKVFINAFDKMYDAVLNTPRPFLYTVNGRGGIKRVHLSPQMMFPFDKVAPLIYEASPASQDQDPSSGQK